MTTEQWVKRLREIGDEMDELMASLHPSAWDQALKLQKEEWRKIASRKCDDED